jgi:hypothetical protein
MRQQNDQAMRSMQTWYDPHTKKSRRLRLEPFCSLEPFTPQTLCPHGVWIAPGWVCLHCSRCGNDGRHKDLVIRSGEMPARDPRPKRSKILDKLTRREARAKLYHA